MNPQLIGDALENFYINIVHEPGNMLQFLPKAKEKRELRIGQMRAYLEAEA